MIFGINSTSVEISQVVVMPNITIFGILVSYSHSSAFTSSKHDNLPFLIRGIIFVETKITKLNPDPLLVA